MIAPQGKILRDALGGNCEGKPFYLAEPRKLPALEAFPVSFAGAQIGSDNHILTAIVFSFFAKSENKKIVKDASRPRSLSS